VYPSIQQMREALERWGWEVSEYETRESEDEYGPNPEGTPLFCVTVRQKGRDVWWFTRPSLEAAYRLVVRAVVPLDKAVKL